MIINDFRFGREIIRPFFGQDVANPDITQFFMYDVLNVT